MKDYYALLGLEQKATKAEIKKNYRLLASKYHPDKNSAPSAAGTFIAITEAYDTLSNRKSRAAYDLIRWQALKNKQANQDSYTAVVPPQESTRSLRNKAQQKRSIKYHKTKGEVKKTLLLNLESLYILGRYVLLIMAMTLMAVILNSALTEILSGVETSIGIRLVLGILIAFLIWGLFKIALNIITEIKKDLVLFSIYYKITHKKAIQFALPVFVLGLILYLLILQFYR